MPDPDAAVADCTVLPSGEAKLKRGQARMQYALVDGSRRTAFPKGRGICPVCQNRAVARCGPRVIDHWAHAPGCSCDPWWENETPWHRAWKDLFPEECREICRIADGGEIHRADLITPTGIVIEVQNSPMADGERVSRERFYKNMVWIVNGASFKERFHILHHLPAPDSEIAQDLRWFKVKDGEARGIFWRPSENADHLAGLTSMVEVHGIHKIEDAVNAAYCGHHQFDWVRPRVGWLESGAPVFIDFGDDRLVQLMTYPHGELPCIKLVSKRKFLHDVMVETRADAIATRFYRIGPDQLSAPARTYSTQQS